MIKRKYNKKEKKKPDPMSFGPREFDADGNCLGSRIFLHGLHHMPKKEAHSLGLYGRQSNLDKDFCVITQDEYMNANSIADRFEVIVNIKNKEKNDG